MSLAARTRIGRYEIRALLGAGGMGEVYRARDERLGRDVAIKVLSEELASDRGRLKRFEREARAASSLSHPNIVTILAVEQEGAASFIVMELVEGRTLREVMEDGALPARRLLPLGAQIAEGLARAHAAGIVHRDLKPENVMVTRDGGIKILDFGLAKLARPDQDEGQPVEGATVTQMTTPGIVMGTVGYMSPEQASGRPVDYRSDQFSLGAMLHEMATGKPPFRRETAVQTLAAIIQEEPESLAVASPRTPAPVRWIIERCLAKEPGARYASTEDLARDLSTVRDRLSEFGSGGTVASQTKRRLGRRGALVVGAAAVLASGLVALALMRKPAATPFPRRYFDLAPPAGIVASFPQVSPDGRRVVFEAITGERIRALYLREFSEPEARPLPGTEGGGAPFWSPDSRTIGFFTALPTQQPRGGKLKRIGISDASPLEICDAPDADGGSWGSSDVIIFGRGNGPLQRVSASGGQPTAASRLDSERGERLHVSPRFLPDGQRFLFLSQLKDGSIELEAGSLNEGEIKHLGKVESVVDYSAPGYLLSVTGEGTLVADRFDADGLRILGNRFPVAQKLAEKWFSVSQNGVLAYQRVGNSEPRKLVWFDRSGRVIERIPLGKDPDDLALSPDGSRAAISMIDPNASVPNLWLYEVGRGTLTRLTADARAAFYYPAWSRDGRRLAFTSNRQGGFDVYVKSVGSSAPDTRLVESDFDKLPNDWSPDGRFLLYEDKSEGKTSLWAVETSGASKPFRVTHTPFREEYGRFSPDGELIAYLSDETGQNEVYVQPFPEGTQRWQVSAGGAGQRPLWRADGRELFYVSAENQLMSVAIERKPVFKAGSPQVLFRVREPSVEGRLSATNTPIRYDVTPDGQRFLVSYSERDAPPRPTTVVLNWLDTQP